MRPAKSFWKKVQLWRTTCQWLCQRIRLVSPGAIAWFVTRYCAKIAAGRSTSSTAAMPISCGAASRSRLCGSCAVISETTRPRKTGIVASSSATAKPAANRHEHEPARLAHEMPVEARQRFRRRARRHRARGGQPVLEEPEQHANRDGPARAGGQTNLPSGGAGMSPPLGYSAAMRGGSTMPAACCRSTESRRETPRSCIVTP